MHAAPYVSVIVCTRNRAETLGACLRSLLADRSQIERELIVVDNGSSDETLHVVDALARTSGVPVRYAFEPQAGLSRARNLGVSLARGEVLLFTDDDVEVEDGWADELVTAFRDTSVGAVIGRVLPRWETPAPAWLDGPQFGQVVLHDYGESDRPLADHEPALGANMAIRALLLRVSDPPFEPSLGQRGTRRFHHEDAHVIDRIRRTHTVLYVSGARVHHRVSPERLTLRWMRGSFFDFGVGLARRQRLDRASYPRFPVRVVRSWRTYRFARSLARRNRDAERQGHETWQEMLAYMEAGRHFDMAFGRTRVATWLGGIAGRRG